MIGNGRQPGAQEAAWQQATRRCERIGQAGRSMRKRIQLVRTLLLPKVLWSAAWAPPTANQMSVLRSGIARLINGGCRGNHALCYSNFLWWEVHGDPAACPFSTLPRSRSVWRLGASAG